MVVLNVVAVGILRTHSPGANVEANAANDADVTSNAKSMTYARTVWSAGGGMTAVSSETIEGKAYTRP